MSEEEVSPPEEGLKQQGITISFVVVHGDNQVESVLAQQYLNSFHESVQILAQDGFPRLKATLTSRQEYLPRS